MAPNSNTDRPGQARAGSPTGAAPDQQYATLKLVLYSRPGCHLCDVAKAAAEPLLRRYGVVLEERNVEDDPAWEAAFGTSIPVGTIDGRMVFKYRVDPSQLERALRARLGAC